MDSLVGPKTISEYVGNTKAVQCLRNWLETIIENPKTPKRVCFLTGPTGSGKSCLVRLLLNKYGFSLREFSSSDLRTKPTRNLLMQTMRFHDVLALFDKLSSKQNKEFRKAVLIENLENMGLATQEVYRTIKHLIKDNKTIGVPIILTGNKMFKGKKPMMGNSIFVHLQSRTLKETQLILQHFIQIINKKYNHILKPIINHPADQMKLAKHCGGDVRRIIKHFEYHLEYQDHPNHEMRMDSHDPQGQTFCLWRILNITNDRTIREIVMDTVTEGIVIPFGIHWTYLEYVPWIVSEYVGEDKKLCRKLWKEISMLIAEYGTLLDKERSCNFWNLRDIANVLIGYGVRTTLQQVKENKKVKQKKIQKKNYWWIEVEKGKRPGDTPIETPCMTKTLRASLETYQRHNLCFHMVVQERGKARAWCPSTFRRTAELLNITGTKNPIFPEKERIVKWASMKKK